MTPAAWLPIIEAEVTSLTRCLDCGTVATWPERRCAHCQKARRLEASRKAKERAQAKQQALKCSVCKVQRLIEPRQRVCPSCKAKARRERNRRYQKSLKDEKLRRFQPDFTRESDGNILSKHIKRHPSKMSPRRRLI
jgi:uncharacterized OB-fold protein